MLIFLLILPNVTSHAAAPGKITTRHILLDAQLKTLQNSAKHTIKYTNLFLHRAESIPVLMYHHILPQEDMMKYGWNNNSAVISLESFKEQMKYLYENDFYTATLEELDKFIKGEVLLPKKTVVITFDDGYLSNIVNAYPIMKEYKQKGTIFLIGSLSHQPQEAYTPHSTPKISVDIMDDYRDVFEYGSHTYDMHDMENGRTRVEYYSQDQIREDLLANMDLFPNNTIAYPHGRYNTNILNVLIELDFKLGFTIKKGYTSRNTPIYEIPRINIGPEISLDKYIQIVTKF